MYSKDQSIEFEAYGNPHAWFLVATELHEQAKLLKSSNTSQISRINHVQKNNSSWNTSNRSTFLLAGFALENILKAYLVYENPQFIKDGFLASDIKTHKLTKLAKKSTLVPYKLRSINTLKYFEDGLESWARYPCGLNWAQTKEQELLKEKMWKNYLSLMKSYEVKFKKLIAKGWKGPHAFEGSFKITGIWLG